MLKGLPIRGKPVDWCDYDLPANKVLQTFPRSSSWDDLGSAAWTYNCSLPQQTKVFKDG